MKIMLEEITNGDAAHWGDSTRRITGSFIAIEQREEYIHKQCCRCG
jgi:hypothetical protein